MSIEFVEKKRAEAAAARAEHRAEYVALVLKLGRGEKLSKPQDAKLSQLMESLGYGLDQIERDLADVAREATMQADATGAEECEQRSQETAAQWETVKAETDTQLQAIQQRRQDAFMAMDGAKSALQSKKSAKGLLDVFHRERADLFGGPSTEEFSRKRHLVQTVNGRIPQVHDSIEFESLMMAPEYFNLAGDYVVAAGQTAAELAELLSRATAMLAAFKANSIFRGWYLTTTEVRGKQTNSSSTFIVDAPVVDQRFDVTGYSWQRLPDQSEEELATLIAKLKHRITDARGADDRMSSLIGRPTRQGEVRIIEHHIEQRSA